MQCNARPSEPEQQPHGILHRQLATECMAVAFKAGTVCTLCALQSRASCLVVRFLYPAKDWHREYPSCPGSSSPVQSAQSAQPDPPAVDRCIFPLT